MSHLLRLEKPGQAEEVFLLGGTRRGGRAELATVIEHPVKVRRCVEHLDLRSQQVVRSVPLSPSLGQFLLLGRLPGRAEHVVPFGFKFGGVAEQDRYRGHKHRGRLAAAAGADEPAHGLREEQRRADARRVDPDRQPGNVHAFGHHPDRDHPAVIGGGERGDLPAGRWVIGQHDHRALPGDPAQQRRVGARVLVIARDHQPGRVSHTAPDLGEPLVGRLQDPGDPLTGRVECGPPRLRDLFPGHRGAKGGGNLVAGPGPPAHLTRVGEKDHRTDHPVLQGVPVAVDVVGGASAGTVQLLVVADEWDRVGIAAERRPGQCDPAPRRIERLPDGITPRQRIAGVVDLVEDDERTPALGALPVQRRMRCHLRVRDGHAREVGGRPALGVAVRGVQRDAEPERRGRPLVLEVLGGRDHRQGGDLPAREQFGRDGQGVGGLPGPGGRVEQEIPPRHAEVLEAGRTLPHTQRTEQILPNEDMAAHATWRQR